MRADRDGKAEGYVGNDGLLSIVASHRFNHLDRGRLVLLVPGGPRVCQIVAVKVLDKIQGNCV
jgi:hypothetical protein